jgi:hypothetical protein
MGPWRVRIASAVIFNAWPHALHGWSMPISTVKRLKDNADPERPPIFRASTA